MKLANQVVGGKPGAPDRERRQQERRQKLHRADCAAEKPDPATRASVISRGYVASISVTAAIPVKSHRLG